MQNWCYQYNCYCDVADEHGSCKSTACIKSRSIVYEKVNNFDECEKYRGNMELTKLIEKEPYSYEVLEDERVIAGFVFLSDALAFIGSCEDEEQPNWAYTIRRIGE